MNGAIPHSFMAAVTRYASYTYKLDRIVSDIKLHLYHLPGDSSWFPWPENPVEHQQRIKQTLDTWWQEASQDEFDFPSLDNRQREVWRLKLRIKYHTATVLLFQPSQVVRNPPSQALQLCFDSSSSILEGYERLHDLHSLHHGWRAVQNIFAAGATLIYSFWTSLQVRKKASTTSMSKNLRTCSSLLTIHLLLDSCASSRSVDFSKNAVNSWVVVAHAFNPSTWGAETGGFLSSWQAWSTE